MGPTILNLLSRVGCFSVVFRLLWLPLKESNVIFVFRIRFCTTWVPTTSYYKLNIPYDFFLKLLLYHFWIQGYLSSILKIIFYIRVMLGVVELLLSGPCLVLRLAGSTDSLLLIALLACERPTNELPAWAPPPAVAPPPPFWHGKCCCLMPTPATTRQTRLYLLLTIDQIDAILNNQ